MAQPFQARVLGSQVRVLAQDPQHAHQLPHPFEVIFRLWGEGRGTTDGRTPPLSPALPRAQPSTAVPGGVPSECAGGLGPGFGQNLRGDQKIQKSREIIFLCSI